MKMVDFGYSDGTSQCRVFSFHNLTTIMILSVCVSNVSSSDLHDLVIFANWSLKIKAKIEP